MPGFDPDTSGVSAPPETGTEETQGVQAGPTEGTTLELTAGVSPNLRQEEEEEVPPRALKEKYNPNIDASRKTKL